MNARKLDLAPDSVSVVSNTRQVIVALPSFEWNFAAGEVRLCSVLARARFRLCAESSLTSEGQLAAVIPPRPANSMSRRPERVMCRAHAAGRHRRTRNWL